MLSILKDNNVTMHFVLLCETFLTNNNADLFAIPGYNFVHMSRTKLSRGGVAMYISNKYNYAERIFLCINVEGEFESIAIEVDTGQKASNLIVAEIIPMRICPFSVTIEPLLCCQDQTGTLL